MKRKSCGQCLRAALTCFGYRDTEQLRIRDESELTERKALARISAVPPQTLLISIEDRARCCFFSHYVVGMSRTYDVLQPLYEQCPSDKHLSATVDAVSLAFFSFHDYDARASIFAQKKYSKALPLLNAALRSSETATSDSTLLAILLLDLFEKLTKNSPHSIDSWMGHVNGALALIDMRGKPHLQDDTGLRLSVRLSTNLLISCVAANLPVPPALAQLRSNLEPHLNKEDPKWRTSGLVAKYANLQGAITDQHLSNSDIVGHATCLDREFKALINRMPPAWRYITTRIESTSERVYNQHFDHYADHFIAQTWNVIRCMRILLNNIISIHSAKQGLGTSSFAHQAVLATLTIDVLAKDVCASIPQWTSYQNHSRKTKDYDAIQKLRCYIILWPLYVAAKYATPMTKIKPWALSQLRFIRCDIGIKNAGAVADILEKAPETCPWALYAMLGSYAFAA